MADKFSATGIVPTSGLAAWHKIEIGFTGHDIIYDYSGNNIHVSTPNTPPQVQSNVLNGNPAMYWSGTAKPLLSTTPVSVQHVFLVAAYDGAAFAGNEGLISNPTFVGVLTGAGAATTKFEDLDSGEFGAYVYKKNSTVFAAGNHQAPMGLANTSLIEIVFTSLDSFDTGLQFGQNIDNTARKWKGWLFESIIYQSALTATEIAKIYLYFNIKYGLHTKGIPLRFPDPLLTGIPYYRFNEEPKDYGDVTEEYTFEDRSKTFWEVAEPENAPQFWEVEPIKCVTNEQAVIYDEFWKQARKVNPFTFVDKFGTAHENVRIANYSRNHEGHNPGKIKEVKFRLVKYA